MEPAAARRFAAISAACVAIGLAMAVAAKVLLWLIAVVTNLAFYHRLSDARVVAAGHHLGAWVIVVPAIGGLIVGLMARYGSRAIQGHGIPEAMEQVLLNGSRVPAKVLALKPLSTCIVIGTGGPFGAEGVVIATGGALGSLLGQFAPTTAIERKTLLAAGAAAGLSAAFACPISAVLLAVELLLFEFHPRSLIPVALASAAACALRSAVLEPGPMFHVPALPAASAWTLGGYLVLGAALGLLAVAVVELVHRAEHFFESLPLHWMWKPALGGLGIGLLALVDPRVLGPGYPDIQSVLSGAFTAASAGRLGALKLAAWVAGVGSATSSGTLAPLLLIGASGGTMIAHAMGTLLDPRVAALAGMAAFFGGMSGAFLASVVLAFESTYQPAVLMPLLAAAASSYLVCRILSRENIMTQKFVRQGMAVPEGFVANPLDWMHVAEALTRRESSPEFEALRAAGAVVSEDATLREAARRMIERGAERLAVLSCSQPSTIVGMITQRDVLAVLRSEDGVGSARPENLLTSLVANRRTE